MLRYMKTGDAQHNAVAFAFDSPQRARVEQLINRNFEDVRHLAVGRTQPRARVDRGDDRIQAEPADRYIERRQRTQHANIVAFERDFLVRLTHCRLLERLAWLDDAARQRDLSGMPRRLAADGEDDVRGGNETQRPRRAQR